MAIMLPVQLLHPGAPSPGLFRLADHPVDRPRRLQLHHEKLGHLLVPGPDLFVALLWLRLLLEAHGYRPACNGARIDTWVTKRTRTGTGGARVSVTEFGRAITYQHLVWTFREAEPALIGTVAEQLDYHRRWRASFPPSAEAETLDAIGEARVPPDGRVFQAHAPVEPLAAVPPDLVIGGWEIDAERLAAGPFTPGLQWAEGSSM